MFKTQLYIQISEGCRDKPKNSVHCSFTTRPSNSPRGTEEQIMLMVKNPSLLPTLNWMNPIHTVTGSLQIASTACPYLSLSAPDCFLPVWLQSKILSKFSPPVCMLHVSPTSLTSVTVVACIAWLAAAGVWGDTHSVHTATTHRYAACASPIWHMSGTTYVHHSFTHLRLKHNNL